ncbi:Efflux pump aflT [Zalerion maritima]|uniref:Efflux pump aflT n=1 Tax=Zalerion maritima TaxID=339359 RepID=A0AAD5RNT0_9PEZI|nr:Efflux pump aflT [Zalerion maritima]
MKLTYFNRNTHLQLAASDMAPPSSRPAMLARANTEEIIPTYFPYSVYATSARTITRIIEYIPDPPMF